MDFKGRAKKWDNDTRIKRSEIIAKKISEIVGNKKACSIMEYGCATGLIGFNLCNDFRNSSFSNIKSETFFNGQKKYENKIIPYSLFYTIGEKQ